MCNRNTWNELWTNETRSFVLISSRLCFIFYASVFILYRSRRKSELLLSGRFELRLIRQPKSGWSAYWVHFVSPRQFWLHLACNFTAFSRNSGLNFNYNLILHFLWRHDHRRQVNSVLYLALDLFEWLLHHCFRIKLILLLGIYLLLESIYFLRQLQDLRLDYPAFTCRSKINRRVVWVHLTMLSQQLALFKCELSQRFLDIADSVQNCHRVLFFKGAVNHFLLA